MNGVQYYSKYMEAIMGGMIEEGLTPQQGEQAGWSKLMQVATGIFAIPQTFYFTASALSDELRSLSDSNPWVAICRIGRHFHHAP